MMLAAEFNPVTPFERELAGAAYISAATRSHVNDRLGNRIVYELRGNLTPTTSWAGPEAAIFAEMAEHWARVLDVVDAHGWYREGLGLDIAAGISHTFGTAPRTLWEATFWIVISQPKVGAEP